MNWESFLTIGHIVGTVLGVGGATFAEIFHVQANRDGVVDESEKSFLRTTYTVMRLGLIILVLSGFGYLLLLRFSGETQYIYSPRLWAKMIITLIILVNAVLLHLHRIPLWLGSAVSLTSWYAALVIGAWRMRASFAVIMGVYIAAIFIVALIQEHIRKSLQTKT